MVSVQIPLAAFMRRHDSLSIGSNDKYEAEIMQITAGLKVYPTFLYKLFMKTKSARTWPDCLLTGNRRFCFIHCPKNDLFIKKPGEVFPIIP